MTTPDLDPVPAGSPPIDGRTEFTQALQAAMEGAVQARSREIWLVDPDFETWPLDDPRVLAALAAWGKLPMRRLLIVACHFDVIPRRYPRFTEWRGTWAHVVEARATDVEPSQVPSLCLAGPTSLRLVDRHRWRGHRVIGDKALADWREVVDVLLQRSEPGFAANTLGL